MADDKIYIDGDFNDSYEARIKKSKRRRIKRQLTEREKEKGRSSTYWQMTAEEQWAEDDRLGILDWDGS